jgi:hypothetical protein
MGPEGGSAGAVRKPGRTLEGRLVEAADQQEGRVLQGGGAGQEDRVPAAVGEPPALDPGDAGLQHREPPVEGRGGGHGRAAEPGLALHQGLHVVEGVEPFAGRCGDEKERISPRLT